MGSCQLLDRKNYSHMSLIICKKIIFISKMLKEFEMFVFCKRVGKQEQLIFWIKESQITALGYPIHVAIKKRLVLYNYLFYKFHMRKQKSKRLIIKLATGLKIEFSHGLPRKAPRPGLYCNLIPPSETPLECKDSKD